MKNFSSISGLLCSLLLLFSTAAANAYSPGSNLLLADTVKPVIYLSGGDTVSSELWYHFTDPGYTAFDSVDGNLDSLIVIVSNVDTANTGYYLITYDVSDAAGNAAVQRRRVVHITPDVTKPVISLTGGTPYLLSVYSPFTEPGFSATDHYNRNLDSLVQVSGSVDTNWLGTYPITYEVTDAAGNKASIDRLVMVSDTSKPVQTLIGNGLYTVCRWNVFVDPGVIITDNYDAHFMPTMRSNLNTLYEGIYYISYHVTDSSGNVADSVYRVIYVQNCWGIEESEKGIFLQVFPNPSSGIFNINTVKPIQPAELKIYNFMGQEVSGFILHSTAAERSYTLDMNGSPAGVYFIRMVNKGVALNKKIFLTE
jgi:hypothetical protein